jgi:hypothetical protein
VLEPHLVQPHFELFGDQHWNRRVGALAHFDIRHGEDDLPVGPDADECVRCERIRLRGTGRRQVQAQHESAARRRLQQPAP